MTNIWKNKLNDDPVPWLFESNSYTRYRTIIDIMELAEDSDLAMEAKSDLLKDVKIRDLIKET